MSHILYVLDRLTVKPIKVLLKEEQGSPDVKPGDQIIFSLTEDNKIKYMMGNVIGFACECNKE